MTQKLIFILLMAIFCFEAKSQQLLLDNQYLINKFALSPAYAGYNRNAEVFLGYRQQWAGIEGAPSKQFISLNGPVVKKSGLGLTINKVKTGNFSHFTTSFNYAYHVQIGKIQSVSFGIGGEFYRNQIEGSMINPSGGDPAVLNNEVLTGTTFNASFGLLYNVKNFNLGIVLPRLMPAKIAYNTGNNFTVANQYLVHISYLLVVSRSLEVEPFVVARGTQQSGVYYEGSLMFKYKKKGWLAATYKLNGFAMSIGAALSARIVMNYTYEFGGNDIIALSSGTHEISLGFLIKRTTQRDVPPTIFPQSDDDPITFNTKDIDAKIRKLQEKQNADSASFVKKINDLEATIAKLETGTPVKVADKKIDPLPKPEGTWSPAQQLKNIKFANSSATLFSSSYPELNKLGFTLKAQTGIKKILITGHTDDVGSPRRNEQLSLQRAQSVKDYLVNTRGVEESRIEVAGKGSKVPLASNETDEGRQINRRIDIQFMK